MDYRSFQRILMIVLHLICLIYIGKCFIYIYMRYLININWLIKFLNLNFSVLVPNVKLKILILCSSLFLFVSINFNKFHSF